MLLAHVNGVGVAVVVLGLLVAGLFLVSCVAVFAMIVWQVRAAFLAHRERRRVE